LPEAITKQELGLAEQKATMNSRVSATLDYLLLYIVRLSV
jgi:hypothetical protein